MDGLLAAYLSISLFCIFCQNHATLLHQFLAFSLSRFLAFYLSYFTRARDNHLQCYIRSQATDDGSSKIKPVMEVLPLAYTDALSTLQPAVVVCAWMPSGVDFSKAIRTCPTVLEMVRACTYRCKSCGRTCECHYSTVLGLWIYMRTAFNGVNMLPHAAAHPHTRGHT